MPSSPSSPRRRLLRPTLTLLTATAAATALAQPAYAANPAQTKTVSADPSLTVTTCGDPTTKRPVAGTAALPAGWSFTDSHPSEQNWNYAAFCDAPTNPAVRMAIRVNHPNNMLGGRTLEARFSAPADSSITRWELWSSGDGGPPINGTLSVFDETGGPALSCIAGGIACQTGTDWGADSKLSRSVPSGTGYVAVKLGCSASCYMNGYGWFMLRTGRFTLKDPVAPDIDNVGGQLLDGTAQKGLRELSVTLRDRGLGVRSVSVRSSRMVEPVVTQFVGSAGCQGGTDMNEVPPCPVAPGAQNLQLDTTELPEGEQTLAVTVTDAVGSTSTVTRSILVDNLPAPVNTRAPKASGATTVGYSLVADDGAWTGSNLQLTHLWQYEVDGAWLPAPGQNTGSTYVLPRATIGHRVRVAVTATNDDSAVTAASDATGPIVSGDVQSIITIPAPKADVGAVAGATTSGGSPQTTVPAPGPVAPSVGAPAAAPVPASVTSAGTANGTNASSAAVLKATFESTASRTLTVRYGRSAAVTGTLLGQAGKAIGGASLDVWVRSGAAGAQWKLSSSITSDSRGRFSYTAPKGGSRTVRIAYRARTDQSDYSRTQEVSIRVRPSIWLRPHAKSLHNGRRLTLAGRVNGAPATSKKVVEIQVRDGGRWRTIASTRLKRGRFTYAYRFTRTFRTTDYAFRALIRSEGGWSFITGASKAAKIRVRP